MRRLELCTAAQFAAPIIRALNTLSQPGESGAYKRMATLGMTISDPIRIEEWSKPMQPLWQQMTSKTPGADGLLKLILETK